MSIAAAEPGRTASGAPRVRALDGFRAYALLAVLYIHLLGASGVLARFAGTNEAVLFWAVSGNSLDAFFMISGFVLFMPTIMRNGEFGGPVRFWISRGARLLPAYWLVIASSLLLIALVPPSATYGLPPVHSILAHFTVLQTLVRMLDPGVTQGFGLVGPVWMVSVVVCFYLVLPFVARAYYRHPLLGLGVAAAITVGWKLAINNAPGVFVALSDASIPDRGVQLIATDQIPGWAFSFALGMTGAWACIRLRERYPPAKLARAALLAAPAVVALYIYGVYLFGNTTLIYAHAIGPVARGEILDTLFGSVARAALIGVVILGPVWMQRPFVNRVTNRLAELSYGVYLIHLPLIIYANAALDLPRQRHPQDARDLGRCDRARLAPVGHALAALRRAPGPALDQGVEGARSRAGRAGARGGDVAARAEPEPASGFEPLTPSLRVKCSTN